MNNPEGIIATQREILKSFKSGMSETFEREICMRLTYKYLLSQDKFFLVQYGFFKLLTMIIL